jgi:hypothetical protein
MSFNTLNASELIDALRQENPDHKVYGTISYGDRINTMQAIPVTDVNNAHLCATTYSQTGYKLVESGDEDDTSENIIILNQQELDGFRGDVITVSELIEQLEDEEQDMHVAMCTEYGDRVSTMQAIPATEVATAFLATTEYSNTKLKLVESGDEDENAEEVVVINYDFL